MRPGCHWEADCGGAIEGLIASGFINSAFEGSMTNTKRWLSVCCLVALMGVVGFSVPKASAFDSHLCGVNGTNLGTQERCPGMSPRHSWKRAVAYRVSTGTEMCVIVKKGQKPWRVLFTRCSTAKTSIEIPPHDLDNGHQLTKIFNKNNNVAVGGHPHNGNVERRWLYANTQ